MPFVQYRRLESPVWACKLTVASQQQIADEISSSIVLGQLADWKIELNDINNCQEHTFRYRNDTATIRLSLNNWLVRKPDGRLIVMSDDEFSATYCNDTIDYVIPEDKRSNFKEALLKHVNATFPELYMTNATPSITPYANLVPKAAEGSEKLVVAIDGATVRVTGVEPVAPEEGATEADGAVATVEPVTGKVKITLVGAMTITKYLIAMEGDSYNAPKSWTITARNTVDGTEQVIANVAAGDVKPGFYSPSSKFMADEFEFDFTSFELEDQPVKGFRIALTTGGEVVAVEDPKPFDKFTPGMLEAAAEKLAVWYNTDVNRFTISLPTYGLVSLEGIAELLPAIMKASYMKPDTTIAFNFNNNVVTEDRQPNQFDVTALQYFTYELLKLDADIRNRIVEINFSASNDNVPSAVCASVTANTMKIWNDFVELIIANTGISQPGYIKK